MISYASDFTEYRIYWSIMALCNYIVVHRRRRRERRGEETPKSKARKAQSLYIME